MRIEELQTEEKKPVDTEAPTEPPPPPPKSRRTGFACLSTEQRREISRRGGKAAHARGAAHRWTTETARTAGRKGGRARKARAEGGAS